MKSVVKVRSTMMSVLRFQATGANTRNSRLQQRHRSHERVLATLLLQALLQVSLATLLLQALLQVSLAMLLLQALLQVSLTTLLLQALLK